MPEFNLYVCIVDLREFSMQLFNQALREKSIFFQLTWKGIIFINSKTYMNIWLFYSLLANVQIWMLATTCDNWWWLILQLALINTSLGWHHSNVKRYCSFSTSCKTVIMEMETKDNYNFWKLITIIDQLYKWNNSAVTEQTGFPSIGW